jgi:hypothetical protein
MDSSLCREPDSEVMKAQDSADARGSIRIGTLEGKEIAGSARESPRAPSNYRAPASAGAGLTSSLITS